MRGMLIALAVACLVTSACGVVEAVTGPGADQCNQWIDELNALVVDPADEPATQQEIEQLTTDVDPCLSFENILDGAVNWQRVDQPLTLGTRTCLEPYVEEHRVSWVILDHNRVHRLSTPEPHGSRWVTAMSACVPGSYLLGTFVDAGGVGPEDEACLDRVYQPEHLEPFYVNLNRQADFVPYGEWSDAESHYAFAPMYECVDFIRDNNTPEFVALLSDTTWNCIEPLELKYLVGVRELQGAVVNEFNREFGVCLTDEERNDPDVQAAFAG